MFFLNCTAKYKQQLQIYKNNYCGWGFYCQEIAIKGVFSNKFTYITTAYVVVDWSGYR
jgi:hypothetical protein